MKKIFIIFQILCAAVIFQATTLKAADSLEDLGFETIDTEGENWGEDTYWGWISPLGNGWFFHDWTWTYYWSSGEGKINSEEGIFLYNDSSKAWIWTNKDVFPQYYDYNAEDWIWLP